MKKILIEAKPITKPNGEKTFALTIPSEYNRHVVSQMVRSGRATLFELTPRIRASKSQRGYLEGAVIPAYAKYQYGLDPTNPQTAEMARDLFKTDFNGAIIKNRSGEPTRMAQSLKGKHREMLDKYTDIATENGLPIPNENLYKLWKQQYSMDTRWSNYYDWLKYLELEEDAMPSQEYLNQKL